MKINFNYNSFFMFFKEGLNNFILISINYYIWSLNNKQNYKKKLDYQYRYWEYTIA